VPRPGMRRPFCLTSWGGGSTTPTSLAITITSSVGPGPPGGDDEGWREGFEGAGRPAPGPGGGGRQGF